MRRRAPAAELAGLPSPDGPDRRPSTETLLRAKARECADLRELLTAVEQDLERLACPHPEHARVFSARAMRLRRRLWEAGS